MIKNTTKNRIKLKFNQEVDKVGKLKMSLSSLSSLSDKEQTEAAERVETVVQPQGPRQRFIPNRISLFDANDGENFRMLYGFTKPAVVRILSMIGDLEPVTQRSKPLDGMTQLLICLRFYVTGSIHQLSRDLGHVIHKSSICRAVQRVTNIIANLRPKYAIMPTTTSELQTTAEEFYKLAGFPRVAGIVDCTQVKIISKGGMLGEHFKCKKGHHSINVQVVCDARMRIRDIIARWPGSVQDCAIFHNSHLHADFEKGVYGQYYLLGDGAYYCKRYLLTPFMQPTTPNEEAYNYIHATTRIPVERSIDMWKRRFLCLEKGITLRKTSTIVEVIVATAVMHNMGIMLNEMEAPPHNIQIETQDEMDVSEGLAEDSHDTSVRTALVNCVFSL